MRISTFCDSALSASSRHQLVVRRQLVPGTRPVVVARRTGRDVCRGCGPFFLRRLWPSEVPSAGMDIRGNQRCTLRAEDSESAFFLAEDIRGGPVLSAVSW